MEVGEVSDPDVVVGDAVAPVSALDSDADTDADAVGNAVLVSMTEGLAFTGRSG